MTVVHCNGASIPAIGFGTWELRDDVAREMVEAALRIGYRHIDTAQMYGNEREVGAGLRASGIARDQVFLTTKIWPDHFAAANFKKAARERLELLGLDYVDLLLMHWPSRTVPLAETIEALNWARTEGIARHIGVSNFTTTLIDQAVSLSPAPLVCNQIEYHPYLDQSKVLERCGAHGMAVTAYCPIARGRAVSDPLLASIGSAHGKSASQVALRWLVQQPGVIAIPRTRNIERAKENLDIFDFELSAADMDRISALHAADGRVVNIAHAPEWD